MTFVLFCQNSLKSSLRFCKIIEFEIAYFYEIFLPTNDFNSLFICFSFSFLFKCFEVNKIIDDFTDNPEKRWQFYTDQVMGGVSEGGASLRSDSEGPYLRL